MWLDVIKLFMLSFIIVMLFWMLRVLSTEINKSRQIRRLRDIAVDAALAEIKDVASVCVAHKQTVIETQADLDKKVGSLQEVVQNLRSFVTSQQSQFNALAKADLLDARRDELIRAKQLLTCLERIVSISTMSRQEPAAIDTLAIESVRSRISELEKILK